MSIKIKITTEGSNREPYIVEAEIGQDTLVAAFDLINAITSTVIANPDLQKAWTGNIYAWGVKAMEIFAGKNPIPKPPTMNPWYQGTLDLPPDIKNQIINSIYRAMRPGRENQKKSNFDISKLFKDDTATPDPDPEPESEPDEKNNNNKDKKDP